VDGKGYEAHTAAANSGPWLLGLILALQLSACGTYKGYLGPELPNHQVAIVSLKAPTAPLLPIFWIPPLNMLPWFADDWYETSREAAIHINSINIDPRQPDWDGGFRDHLQLTRFNAVKVMPGEYLLSSIDKNNVTDRQPTGDESCSTSNESCTCPSTQQTEENKDKKCTQPVTKCRKTIQVTAHDRHCGTRLMAKPGRSYEIFRRDGIIRAQARFFPEDIQPEGSCDWGEPYTYTTTDENSSTGSCS
jgi:hypothetical protein